MNDTESLDAPLGPGMRVRLRPVKFDIHRQAVLVDDCESGTVVDGGGPWWWVDLDSGTRWRFHRENIMPLTDDEPMDDGGSPVHVES